MNIIIKTFFYHKQTLISLLQALILSKNNKLIIIILNYDQDPQKVHKIFLYNNLQSETITQYFTVQILINMAIIFNKHYKILLGNLLAFVQILYNLKFNKLRFDPIKFMISANPEQLLNKNKINIKHKSHKNRNLNRTPSHAKRTKTQTNLKFTILNNKQHTRKNQKKSKTYSKIVSVKYSKNLCYYLQGISEQKIMFKHKKYQRANSDNIRYYKNYQSFKSPAIKANKLRKNIQKINIKKINIKKYIDKQQSIQIHNDNTLIYDSHNFKEIQQLNQIDSSYFPLPLNSKVCKNLHENNSSKFSDIKSSHSNERKSTKPNQYNMQNPDEKFYPNQFPTLQQLKIINQQINQDKKSLPLMIYNQSIAKERGECLNVLSKICSSMNLSRQTYALALNLIDNFIAKDTLVKNLKIIAITALIMSIKHYSNYQSDIGQFSTLNTLKSCKTINQMSMIDILENSQKYRNLNRGSFRRLQDGYNLHINGSKVLTAVLSHEQIFSQYDRILSKQEIIDMETQITMRISLKSNNFHYIHWISLLTHFWDSIITKSNVQLKKYTSFVSDNAHSHNTFELLQLIEFLYYFPYTNYYPKVTLILSSMYLLIRIHLQFPEKQSQGYEYFKKKLNKSVAILFTDKSGINEIYGQFLQLLKLDMHTIVDCCQYISQYLSKKLVKSFTQSRDDFSNLLSFHHYNPDIFRYFQVKFGSQRNCKKIN